MPAAPHLILGVTRKGDDPTAAITGLIYRDGDKLRWGSLAELLPEPPSKVFYRLIPDTRNQVAYQYLGRLEYTVSGQPRFLFRRDGKLEHHDVRDALQFSEGKKALLKPQQLSQPLPLGPLAVAYLEVSRLSDLMRQEMLGGERTVGDLTTVLGLPVTDQKLDEVLWELSRRDWLSVHAMAKPDETAIGLNKPVPTPKLP